MRRLIGLFALPLMLAAGSTYAQEGPSHPSGGLGFHNVEAPLGVRWWLTGGNFAIAAGIGLGSEEDVGANEDLSHWALDFGVPIRVRNWDRVHFMLRPGILYLSQEEITGPGPETDNGTALQISVELEAEVFLVDRVSVSAAHGFALVNRDPAVGESSTDWGTTGSDFTNIGFHVYVFPNK